VGCALHSPLPLYPAQMAEAKPDTQTLIILSPLRAQVAEVARHFQPAVRAPIRIRTCRSSRHMAFRREWGKLRGESALLNKRYVPLFGFLLNKRYVPLFGLATFSELSR
jgi:hypothetical protein